MPPQNPAPAPINPTPSPIPPRPQGSMGSTMPTSAQPQKGGMGPIIGAVIIVLIIILGGLYFWGEKINKEGAMMQKEQTGDTDTQALEQQGTSDEINSIEKDLNATDLNDLDKESANLDATLAE